MKRYMTMHKTMLATCTQKELDWIVEAYKDVTEYDLLHSETSAFVLTELAAEHLERALNTDDFEVIGLITFLRELDNAGVTWAFLKVKLDEGDA